jgi:hypothetical protein
MAKAFEQAYKESHPNGPYPLLEIKGKQGAVMTTKVPGTT